MSGRQTQVVVVSGLSGAGKSTALAALEDLGFHAIENLPPAVIVRAIEACEAADVRDIALGFGGSVGGFLDGAPEVLTELAAAGRSLTVVYLDAADEVVLRRFNESRRPHPEALRSKMQALLEAVHHERERLSSIRAMATVVIDTSGLTVHELRRRVIALLAPRGGPSRMKARLTSFGFKYGLPVDADLVFDVRFLDNPHFVPELRALTGEDWRVRDYVLEAAGAREFIAKATDLLLFLLPKYEAEGKSYLTIAVGCTGGQHRSIAVTNAIAAALTDARDSQTEISITHRDIRAAAKAREEAGAGKQGP